MKMAGVYSQGIVYPLTILPNMIDDHTISYNQYHEGDDVTNLLGIIKYDEYAGEEPKVGVTKKQYNKLQLLWYKLFGFPQKKKGGFSSLVSKTDEVRIQNVPEALQNKEPVNEALINANNQLCEGNDEGYFVTTWAAVIDLKTGDVEFADAGHELPLVIHTDGSVEGFKPTKKRPPLATMEDLQFLLDRFNLAPGDKLFLYTDGVPEATNAENELYGMDRLKAVLEKNCKATPKEILVAVRADVDAFVGDAPQFDDLTMLAFERK